MSWPAGGLTVGARPGQTEPVEGACLVLWLGSSPTYSWSGCLGGGWVGLVGEAVEVGAGELPLERGGDLLVAAAEGE